ncbi:vWA domain-containing protein, partial [Aminipila sp.]|uniref:vWA domain-containing protein n=1 Tax=Aminipila sp. TaxID=2060095 RepID=UPI00289FD2E3
MKLKRKLALLLVVAMCMTLAPPSAFADTKISPELTKTAQWIDAKEGTAKITLQTKGSPVAINNPGADVVVVMDYSGSMGYDSGITKQCGSTSFTKRGFFSTYYECNSCGATYEHRPEVCTKQVSAGINRWTLAKEALDVSLSTIIPDTKSSNQVAFVAFDSAVRKGYTVDATNKKNQILNLVNGLVTPAPSYPGDPIQKGTNYTEALSKANQYVDSFLRNSNNSKPVYVIFLSDGMPDKGSEGEAYKQTIKNKATVYTIGLSLDNSASNVLKKYASDPTSKHHKNVTDPSDLSDTFSDISTTITSQVTVKDVINQEVFDVVSVGKPTSGTASLALDGKTVIWTLDNFSPAGDTLEIIIKLNKNYIDKYQSFITNESAGANYVDGDGTLKNLTVSNTAPSNEKPVIERSKTQYAVKFYHEDGTTQIGATQLIDSGSAAVMPEGPTKAETASTIYTFAGWVPVDEHAGYTIENIENVTRAMSFKAVFTAREKEKFIVSYNANGGIGTMTSDTAYVGSQITVRANEFTAPANSQFNGWKDASGRNIEVGSLLTENTVLTAQWRLLEEVPGVKAKGYEGIYDGIGHGITVTAPEGAKVEYRVNGADWTEANPKYINAT